MSVAIINGLKRASPALRKINVHIYLSVRKQTELDRTLPLFLFLFHCLKLCKRLLPEVAAAKQPQGHIWGYSEDLLILRHLSPCVTD